jgi:hypothetical protein
MSNSEDPKAMQAFEALNETALAHLQGKYGQEVRLSTTRAALNEILRNIDRRVVGPGGIAAYDRGFDRTSPGYDKYYDRDRAMNPADAIINPGIDVSGMRE